MDRRTEHWGCPLRVLAVAFLLVLAATASAHAQGGRGGGRNRGNDDAPPSSSSSTSTDKSAPTLPPPAQLPWPRLENGSVLCSSRDDLVKYQTQTAGAEGAAGAQEPACITIRQPTGIQILDRDGPSRTQIITTDDAQQTGWTNTYLPLNPPPSAGAPPSSASKSK